MGHVNNSLDETVQNSIPWPKKPIILEINTWTWLHDLSTRLGRKITLENVPDEILTEQLHVYLYDAVWLMGVWERSQKSKEVSIYWEKINHDYQKILPDFKEEDIVGSAYAIRNYNVDPHLGGNRGLETISKQLHQLGKLLILDFVPNHTAIDNTWVNTHPEYFLQASESDLTQNKDIFLKIGERIYAHGRDPYFPSWEDTLQVNPFSDRYRNQSIETLKFIAKYADGIRCDMAMLLVKPVFIRTWSKLTLGQNLKTRPEYWVEVINAVKGDFPQFKFIAEVYWEMERDLHSQGFDYCYDKGLYDYLRDKPSNQIFNYLDRDFKYQSRLIHFTENHDENRAIQAFQSREKSKTATIITLSSPGAVLIHEGQLEGSQIRTPVQLARRPKEISDEELKEFYEQIITIIRDHVSSVKKLNNTSEDSWHLCHITCGSFNLDQELLDLQGKSSKFNISSDIQLANPFIAQCWNHSFVSIVNYSNRTVSGEILLYDLVEYSTLKKMNFRYHLSNLITKEIIKLNITKDHRERESYTFPIELKPWDFMLLQLISE